MLELNKLLPICRTYKLCTDPDIKCTSCKADADGWFGCGTWKTPHCAHSGKGGWCIPKAKQKYIL